jgi:hypothetical protein
MAPMNLQNSTKSSLFYTWPDDDGPMPCKSAWLDGRLRFRMNRPKSHFGAFLLARDGSPDGGHFWTEEAHGIY